MNRIIGIIAFTIFFLPFSLYSQLNEMRIVGAPKEEPGELVSRTMLDANSDVCAGVIIYSDLTGITFRSVNGIVKRNSKPGEDFLFVSPDERMIEVYCIGYAPLKIVLNDVGVRLKSGQTWSMKVTGDKKLDVLPVNFVIDPPDAKIIIDGKDAGSEKMQQLSAGKHELQFKKEGYISQSLTTDISPQNSLFNIKLKEIELATVRIRSVPTGAQILIDNIVKGETDKSLFQYPGSYALKLTKTGYVDVEKKITVEETGDNTFSSTLEKNSAVFDITVSPTNATVTLNDVDYSGKRSLELLPGTYTVKVSKNGYLPAEEKIEIIRGKNITKNYSLEKNSGTLSISVSPSDSRILINREDYSGKTSVELAPGRYKIELQKTGYYDQNETVDLARGQTIRKEFTLTAKTGSLQFSVTPDVAKAQMTRNGAAVYSWEGLKIQKGIPVGEYEITVSAQGYAAQKIKIIVEENKTAVEDVVLKKETAKPAAATTSSSIGDFIFVQGGTFQMGSNEYDSEKPIHSVTLSDFYIGKYEVTQKQWREVMRTNPSNFKGDDRPVEQVSWNDVQQFLQKLNQKEGKEVYRLPTEAEWEYAARGGNASRGYTYSGSNTVEDVAWYDGNSASNTHEVATKQPNELGIYDMSGNVWEWCSDWYDANYYKSSPSENPKGPSSGVSRVLRGGSWNLKPTSFGRRTVAGTVPVFGSASSGFGAPRISSNPLCF